MNRQVMEDSSTEGITGMLRSSLVLILSAACLAIASAQDIHFSQFFHTPLAQGPGQIGQFDGDHRFNGVFRQQWRAVTVPYRTFGLAWDSPRALALHKLGVGAWMFDDRAGDSRLHQFHLGAGASWTERFGAEQAHSLTGGVQVGFTSLSLNEEALSFDAQYNGYYYDPLAATGESFARSSLVHPDVHTGITYRYRPGPRELIQVGYSLFNLTSPRIGFLGGPGVPLDRRSVVQVIMQFPIAAKLDLMPMLNFMAQGTFRESDIGANLRYLLLDRFGLERALLFGLHYRTKDAGYLMAGLQYDDWTFGISYDVNTSDLVPASRNRGGVELTAIRILKRRPVVPVRFKACPPQL